MRGRDELKQNRYGGSCFRSGPYVRQPGKTWREKSRNEGIVMKDGVSGGTSYQETRKTDVPYVHQNSSREHQRSEAKSRRGSSREVVPYEHTSGSQSDGSQGDESIRLGDMRSTRRVASTIVTPSRDLTMEENVTKRTKDIIRSLCFTSLIDQACPTEAGEDQMIDALDDMEVEDQQLGEIMECEVENDDLLGMELKVMEVNKIQQDQSKPRARSDNKVQRSSRRGS